MNTNVKELERWIKDFMDKRKFCGDYAPYMYADEDNAHRLAQSIYSKMKNKEPKYNYQEDDDDWW